MPKKLPIFYSALMLTAVNLLLRFIGTSFQVYLSSRIGAAGIGLLQLVLSVGSLSMTAGMAGIRTATMYLTAEELGHKRPGSVPFVLSGCFLYSILCSGAVCIGLWYFAPQIATGWIGDARTAGAIRLLASFLPINCLCGVMTGFFTAANRIGTLAIVEIFEQLLSMTITIAALFLWAGHDAAKACQAVVLGSGMGACMTLFCLVILRLREKKPNPYKIPIRSRLLKAAVPLALADNLKAGISTTENLMVPKRLARFPGAISPLAAFGMVCGMVFPVLMFPAAILFGLAELLIPELARCAAAGSQRRIQYLAKRSLRVSLLYGCLFCGLMTLLSKDLCVLLYKSEEAGNYLRLYALLIPMLYCDAITDAMIKGLGQQTACVRYNILTSSMDVAFLYLLLPKYGMAGYFFSFLITHLLNFALSFRRLIKITGPIVTDKAPIMTLLATALSLWGASTLPHPVAKGVSFVLLWVSALILLKVVGKDDIYWLKGLIYKRGM